MFRMQDDPKSETPLGDILPLRVMTVLLKNGIHTLEEVRRAYPDQLLKMRGMGMLRFRDIERSLFPGESFTPAIPRPPVRHIKGSSLNGVFSPATVQSLARGGITTVERLLAMDLKQLMRIDGFGVHKLREIEGVLSRSTL